MSDLRLKAYFYEFEPTGVSEVDEILSTVACAGKAYHHTDCWTDETAPYGHHCAGETPIEWIQNAAQRAASYIESLEVGPIDMILHCPSCNALHVDGPSPGWGNPPHKSHLCHHCGEIWRPCDFANQWRGSNRNGRQSRHCRFYSIVDEPESDQEGL